MGQLVLGVQINTQRQQCGCNLSASVFVTVLFQTLDAPIPAQVCSSRRQFGGESESLHRARRQHAMVSWCWCLHSKASAWHASLQVRAAVYKSIATYPIDLLQSLDVQRPLSQYVHQMLSETEPWARRSAEGMVRVALAHEHSHRRHITSANKAGGAGANVSHTLKHRLGTVLPHTLRSRLEGRMKGKVLEHL